MARLNIEDTLDDDPRFHLLQKMVGRQLAYGVWRDVAKLAQNYWKQNKSPIPTNIFKYIENSEAMIDSGMCEEIEGGIKLVGSEEAFAWLVEKQKAGAAGGKKSAKVRKERLGTNQHTFTEANASKTKQTQAELSTPKQTQANASKSNPPTPSLSLTLNNNISSPEGSKELRKKIRQMYFVSIKERYGVEPPPNAKINSQISQLEKRLGSDAVPVVKFFVAQDDQFYKTKMHDIGLCVKDAEALYMRMKSGASFVSSRASPKTFEQQTFDANKQAHMELEALKNAASE